MIQSNVVPHYMTPTHSNQLGFISHAWQDSMWDYFWTINIDKNFILLTRCVFLVCWVKKVKSSHGKSLRKWAQRESRSSSYLYLWVRTDLGVRRRLVNYHKVGTMAFVIIGIMNFNRIIKLKNDTTCSQTRRLRYEMVIESHVIWGLFKFIRFHLDFFDMYGSRIRDPRTVWTRN